MKNYEPVRGTQDYLPKQMQQRQFIANIIEEVYSQNGFLKIKTPIIEDLDLMLGSDGGDNIKLMFKILKRGDKLDLSKPNQSIKDVSDLALRYDLTVPLARFYANNQNFLPMPFKAFQLDEAFRADRPQKGRLRQFTQCDIDILGDKTINAEIELLVCAGQALTSLGFKDFVFKINNRKILNQIIIQNGFNKNQCEHICVILDKYDKIGFEGVQSEMILNNFDPSCTNSLIQTIIDIKENGIQALTKYVEENEHLNNLKTIINTVNELSNNLYSVCFDISIIRGQGYYTDCVFEVYLDGYNGACGGGGRYDNMIGKITKQDCPAVGFSLGFERLFGIISENDVCLFNRKKVALIYTPNDNFVDVKRYADSLKKDYDVSILPKSNNLGHQLQVLKENCFSSFVIFGNNEITELY